MLLVMNIVIIIIVLVSIQVSSIQMHILSPSLFKDNKINEKLVYNNNSMQSNDRFINTTFMKHITTGRVPPLALNFINYVSIVTFTIFGYAK